MASKKFGEYCLRWTDHESLIQGACHNLLSSEKFADVTLFCEGKSLQCHKFILSACSTYFDRIFTESPSCPNPVIILRDVSHHHMQLLLHFIYCGEMTTEESTLGSLIELAQSLCIKGIGEFSGVMPTGLKSVVSTPPDAVSVTRRRPYEPSHAHSKPKKSIKKIAKNHFNTAVAVPSPLVNIIDPEENAEVGETSSALFLTSSTGDDDELIIEGSEYIFPDTDAPNRLSETDQSIVDSNPLDVEQYAIEDFRSRKRNANKSGRDTSVPVIHSIKGSAYTFYKQYTEGNLAAAIRAVKEEGMRKVDASIKFGIPFTTLTRKMTRLYQSDNNQLPVTRKRKKISKEPVAVDDETLEVTDSDILKETNLTDYPSTVETTLNVEVQEARSTTSNSSSTVFKHYKTYSQQDLREAVSAVLRKAMKATEACSHYGIPRTTLTRKLRRCSKETKSTANR